MDDVVLLARVIVAMDTEFIFDMETEGLGGYTPDSVRCVTCSKLGWSYEQLDKVIKLAHDIAEKAET